MARPVMPPADEKPTPEARAEEKRAALLDAAAGVFLRYGYKKTSMDDVARAAGLSRQGLYLRFPSKDELFVAAVRHVVEGSLGAARAALQARDRPLEDRLVAAFSALHGLHFAHGTAPDLLVELMEAATTLLGADVDVAARGFVDDVARALKAAGLPREPRERKAPSSPAAVGGKAVTARELALTLEAAALGLKHSAASSAEYAKGLALVVRVILAGHC